MTKKKRKLLPFVPAKDPNRRLEQMASLATAMKATGMEEFHNELTYVKGMALRSVNRAAFEKGGMQNPKGVMKLRKLQKLVYKSLQESGQSGDVDQVKEKLMEKINSSSKFTLDNKLVHMVVRS